MLSRTAVAGTIMVLFLYTSEVSPFLQSMLWMQYCTVYRER